MKGIRNNFIGGLNMQFDPSRLGETEYPLLFNGRCRDGTIKPVKSPLLVEAPMGNYQGIYAASNYALLIIDGKAYIKNYAVGGNFNQVPDLQLDPNVDVIFAESVPSSTRNFLRVPASDNRNGVVNLQDSLGQTPAAVILQDGINQPWIIKPDGTARVTQRYNEWTTAQPEYVPIGKQMLHDNGILYIVSPDGSLIYRMVTEQPLNGMVNITTPNGDKQGTEEQGGAATVSHAIALDPVTCLAALNTPDNAFFAGTRKLGTMVVPDFDHTLFGEPQFDNIDVFPVGPVNQFSFVEKTGDYLFVTSKGIRSFNATLLLRNESRNVPFSRRIQRLFNNVTQTNPCVGKFDSYIFFSVKSIYGNAVIVYDETIEQFVSIDQYGGVARVKQFATVTTASNETLLFITEDNKLYEYANGETSETAQLYIGDFTSDDPDINQKPAQLKVVITNAQEEGTLTVTPYVDRKRQAKGIHSKDVDSDRAPDDIPLTIPFGDDTVVNSQNFAFNMGLISQGWRVGFLITLDCQAEISHVSLNSEEETQTAGLRDEVDSWARLQGLR